MEKLSPTQRKAVITLIRKGRGKNVLTNYCPISLTKSMAFVWAARLSVIPYLISSNQLGFIKAYLLAKI